MRIKSSSIRLSSCTNITYWRDSERTVYINLNYIIVKGIYTERRNSAKFKQPAVIRINPGITGISTNIREWGLNTMRENTIGSAMHKIVNTIST